MNTRRNFLIIIGAGAAASFTAYAQQNPNKVFRIGLLGVTSAAGYARQIAALRQGLRELGYIEGQNVVIDYRWADGQYDRLNALAAELITLQPDVLITSGPGVRVLKEATTTVPVVMAVGGDVVADGIVASLARPGGNITGSVAFGPELTAKRLEFLKDAVPRITRVAVLLNANNEANNAAPIALLTKAAAVRKVDLIDAPVRSPRDFEQAFAAMRRRQAHGLVVLSESMLVANMRRLGELSVEHRLPGAGSDEFSDGGGLLAYGVNFPELWRRAPYFADRIFKGAKPGDLPIEQPIKFESIVNLKTAKALEIKIPQSVLVRADKVIE